MIINRIELTLEPWRLSTNEIELRLSIGIANEEILYCQEILRPDDMEANFDRYFDFIFKYVKEIMRKELLKRSK